MRGVVVYAAVRLQSRSEPRREGGAQRWIPRTLVMVDVRVKAAKGEVGVGRR